MSKSEFSSSTDTVALKIYGERNTGTNYVTALMQTNLRADILPGRVDDTYLPTIVTRRLRRFMPALGHRLHEAVRDRFFEKTFSENLGWKHMNPDLDRIGQKALADVRFLMVVKNPYSWLLSLHRRPYHVGVKDERFEDFIERRLPVMERRENIGSESLTPVEVWNRKMHGYQSLIAGSSRGIIVRYEDFLQGESVTIERVAAALDLELNDARSTVSAGIKKDDSGKSWQDYSEYYLNEQWRSKISPAALKTINRRLDQDMVAKLGYDMIDPSNGSA